MQTATNFKDLFFKKASTMPAQEDKPEPVSRNERVRQVKTETDRQLKKRVQSAAAAPRTVRLAKTAGDLSLPANRANYLKQLLQARIENR
jgi:hypothetical protein